MTTKYNVGDTIFIPYRISSIRINEEGVSYIINVDSTRVDDKLTYFLDKQASISEQDIEKLFEKHGGIKECSVK